MQPRGKAVSVYSFVYANHADNVVTRRFNTIIIMFIHNTPIIWFSKRHNTVKENTFGSKLVAPNICKDLLNLLRCKLHMFDVKLWYPAYVFYNNHGVVNNMSILSQYFTWTIMKITIIQFVKQLQQIFYKSGKIMDKLILCIC